MNYKEALYYAKTGQAMLFYGAGMACDVKNFDGNSMPLGDTLAERLSNELSLSSPLRKLDRISQLYLKQKGEGELVKFLKNQFITSEVPDYYGNIANIRWHSIFTTNYDDSLESISKNRTPIESEKEFIAGIPLSDYIIHINGYIRNLTEESLHSKFKLTKNSYLEDQFIKQDLYRHFHSEILACKAIFFVGYSFDADFDVTKLFYDHSDTLKSKTFFITRSEDPILDDFGTVMAIGVEQFAKDLYDETENISLPSNIEYTITNFTHKKLTNDDKKVNLNEEVNKLLVEGVVNLELLDKSIIHKNQYAISRIHNIENFLNKDKHMFIYGGIGTGKTILVNQIATYYTIASFDVFFLNENFFSPSEDIDYITKNYSKVVFIIDFDLLDEAVAETIKYILNKTKYINNIKCIISTRTTEFDGLYNNLIKSSIISHDNIIEYSTDTLLDGEFDAFILLLDHHALLRSYLDEIYPNEPNHSNKVNKLKVDTDSHISYTLLSLLNSKNIINKYQPIFKSLSKQNGLLDILIYIFAITLLTGKSISKDALYELLDNDIIIQPDFPQSIGLKNLLYVKTKNINSYSSLFSRFFFHNFEESSYLIGSLINLSKKMYDLKNKSNKLPYSKLYNAIATYTNIQNMIPEKNRRDLLIKFYEGLRTIVKENSNPHYWLQYAIARLSYAEVSPNPHLELAKQYLDNAMSLAKDRRGYKTYDLQTQLARYWLLNAKNIISKSPCKAKENIRLAISHIDEVTLKDPKKASFRPIQLLCELLERIHISFNLDELDMYISKLEVYIDRINKTTYHVQNEKSVLISKNRIDSCIQMLKRHRINLDKA